ncbi:MAG: cytochrome b N-terminal domain-containing protein [Nitrospinae bacterium]|nr:cytochrome b N-terminal domain-containing protein [Nitrospinota bacterium]
MKEGRGGSPIDNIKKSLGISAVHYQIPSYVNRLPYILGGITLISLIILFVSGIILTQFYNPVVSDANRSIVSIKNEVYLGWFVRGIHYWAMNVVIVTALLHLIRAFLTSAYKRPREFTWFTGVLLLSLIGGFIFTGTVLKWDQEGYEALQHHLWVMERLGVIGILLSEKLSSLHILSRLYTIHISILPILSLILLSIHLFLIKVHEISPLPWKGEVRMVDFTSHIKQLTKYGVFSLFLISIVALIIEPPLGGGPVEGIEITKPPWMFLWIYSLENIWGDFLIIAPSIIFMALLLLPIIDRGGSIDLRERKIGVTIFIIVLLLLAGLIINGMITSAGHHMD